MDADLLQTAATWLRDAKRVVVFTGAGISEESGIPTFRDDTGLWREFPPEHFATSAGLLHMAAKEPAELARFLLAVLTPVARARPNEGHHAIASLEGRVDVQVVTQNIDGLHQEAGSRVVHEIHGSLLEVAGAGGQLIRTLERDQLQDIVTKLERSLSRRFKLARVVTAVRPLMGFGTGLVHRPRVVLFGEPMAEPDWRRSEEAAARCDLMIVAGTSLEVWPAASLPHAAAAAGARIIAVNPDEMEADAWLAGTSGDVLPRLVRAAYE